jgi:hypothetical protein
VNSQLSPVRRSPGEGGTFNSQPSVELHIDELGLHGYSPRERYGISNAVERELARLLSQQGIPSSLRSEHTTDEIKGATLDATRNARPHAIGRQIAQAVYQGFSQ